MSGSIASYDQLVRQVEALKKENTHLRRELEDNSSHLSKLENETSDMKVKALPPGEEAARGFIPLLSLFPLLARFPAGPGAGLASAQHWGWGPWSGGSVTALYPLPFSRCFLLSEIEKEEKEKLWYYMQLQSLSTRLDELPHVETFSMQMDLIRQQLEFEAQHIRSLMEERFGTTDEMVQRAQVRAGELLPSRGLFPFSLPPFPPVMQPLPFAKPSNGRDQTAKPSPQRPGADVGAAGNGAGVGSAGPQAAAPVGGSSGANRARCGVEVVFWLLSMLATRDKADMSRTLLAMSSSQESCLAMRKSGCLPLLIQILHDTDREPGGPQSPGSGKDSRMRANAALHNIIFSQPDEGQAKKEMRVLHVLEQIRSYSETCWDWLQMQSKDGVPVPIEPQICQATCAVMKLSFDEEYRRAMNELGGLQAVAELLQVDYEMHKMTSDPLNLALRRYAGMALTNLTFGDVVNKATLSSRRGCMQAIVAQLASESEELHQVVSSILRNLSWRADLNSKKILREVGSVTGLMQCALRAAKESTLKSVLSALWNLSAHSTENKAAICLVQGALGFLVSTLTYKCQSNSLAIIESGGGILRNVSSLIATREDYRQVLRDHNCLQTLLQHLKSHSLTIVSNACGTLWNLSARSPKDQELLWDLGAVSMLRNLIHSKHKMIAMGSAAALRNLLTHRPLKYKDAAVISPGSCMPSLYVRKQKALEAELDAKHLAEAFDTMEKQSLKGQSLKKPLRHMDSLAKDYASDSGCFDDDEVPNVSAGAETGNASILSMFLNSSFLQGQALPRAIAQRRGPEPEKDESGRPAEPKKLPLPEDEVSRAAEKLANKISTTVAKIDKLVEDISTLHTSSDDSFSLSSEDHCLDWPYGPEEAHEARAQSCSPCRLSDASSLVKRENLSRAHTLLRLKKAYTSLSNDSLNSGSTSDGYCTKEHMKPCTGASFLGYKEELQRYQKRPSRLDLKNILVHRPERMEQPGVKAKESGEPEKLKPRDAHDRAKKAVTFPSPNAPEKEPEWKKEPGNELSPDPQVHTIKLSPSYQHVPLLENLAKSSPAPGAVGLSGASYHPTLPGRKQAWLPTGLLPTTENLSKIPEKLAAHTPAPVEQESVQKYAVEDTPICFSRCSSLSSLSSADNVLDGQSHSENEVDSDSSLEIIEVEEGAETEGDVEQAETCNRRQEKVKVVDLGPAAPGGISQPIAIPFQKRDKIFLRESSPSRHEDLTPSSSSENYIQETPLVMSRCSSVSSLGSFESPSIASSIQSDPCSEMISGTISPSELPDSPGQTMPPSRSKTPLFELGSQPEKETSQFNIQWENNVKKFMEITDFKERFQLPQDLDSMIYFTVEKPNENFSCASSLSALPLHEHYIQKDVELKLMPPFPERNSLNFVAHEKPEDGREERFGEGRRKLERPELNSDDDIEILKECINSAMPSRFRKVKTSLVSGLPSQGLNPQTKKALHMPVYMLVPTHSHRGIPKHLRPAARDLFKDDDSFTDSAEGTPINFSSAASLSDETLQYPLKEEVDHKRGPGKRLERKEVAGPPVGCNMEAPREQGSLSPAPARKAASNSSTPTKMSAAYQQKDGSRHGSPVHGRGQAAEVKRGLPPLKNGPNLELDFGRAREAHPEGVPPRKGAPCEDSAPGGMAFQSLCHTTPTEEAVYCFYENDSNELLEVRRDSPKRKKERWSGTAPKKEPEQSSRQLLQAKTKMAAKLRNNLIVDEMPPCYSLSSSMSSLSDIDLCDHEERTMLYKANRQLTLSRMQESAASRALAKERDSSPSSLSFTSDDDLLQKCIGSAVPRRRRHSARRRNAEHKQKLKGANPKSAAGKERTPEPRHNPADEMVSDKGSDLDSVEWKAIQEGANSIVTWLHQAAASLSREPSSESDSILSFVSGLSVGSTLQLSLDRKDKKRARSGLGREVEKRDHVMAFQESKKAMGAGGRNARTEKNGSQQKPMSNLPVVFRGRTVIYVPSAAKDSPSPRSTPQKTATTKPEATIQNLTLSQQRSRSLHRLGKASEMADLTLPKRSATPPARITKPPSSGSCRTSTPSQPTQKKLTSPSQLNKQLPSQGVKVGRSSPTGSAPKAPPQKSPATKQHKTQKSPVRIPFMQKPNKKMLPARSSMPVLEEHVGSPKLKGNGKGVLPTARLNLVRMSSARSSGSESDRSGFLRQLTFIKESSSLIMRHRSDLSSCESTSSLSQSASPKRSRPGLPAVFLCSSRCEELKVAKPAVTSQRPVISRTPANSKTSPSDRPPRRTSSESPSRLPVKTNTPSPEPFKRYSSSPNINIIKRTSSPSSVLSSCSESSARRRKSQEASKLTPNPAVGTPGQQDKQQMAMMKGTWRRIRDEDIPHILKSTLPSSALPLVSTLEEETPKAQIPIQRKTSDAVVQTEDYPTTKTNSSTSPTLETREMPKSETECLTSIKGTVPISFGHEGPTGSVGSFPSSRHSSPSRSARVTPFNYVPSPMVAPMINNKSLEKMPA
uniref:APC regulator of WNT signaling pathway 2 n=2 Tax=Chelydra serpentina TaxID=8475 RepID=A0A8C3XKA3_CHESE